MKKIFTLLFMSILTLSVTAQVKVESNGRMVVGPPATTGTLAPKPLEGDTAATMLVWDRNNPQGGYISFGDKAGWVGQYKTDYTYRISLGSSRGMYFKTTFPVEQTIMDVNWAGVEAFKDIKAPSFITTSDERVKKDINPLSGISSGLLSITPLSYHLIGNDGKNDGNIESDEMIPEDVSGKLSKVKKNDERLRYGFLAQEVQKFYPELVVEGEDGLLGIDYTGFIPLYLEAIQNLTNRVEELQDQIEELEDQVKGDVLNRRLAGLNGEEESALKQNSPNPWSTETAVECFIPEEAASARISIFNYSGDEVRRIACEERGKVTLTVNREGMPKGVYVYSLFVNNVETQSRVMIVKD